MKNRIPPIYTLLGLLCLLASETAAAPVPAPLFGAHAVLQRGVPVPVWGKADPREKVSVRYGQASASAVADADGAWRVQLPALEGGQTGELVFEGDTQTVISQDVVTGDAWLCAGQSNIEFTLRKAEGAPEEIAMAQFPKIRQFKMAARASAVPSRELKGQWAVCSPETAGDFSAIGYYMARDLYQHNQQPQGVINCSYGGTIIESWLSGEALASRPEGKEVVAQWDKLKAEYPEKKAAYDKAMAEWNTASKQAAQAGATFSEKRPTPPSGDPENRNQPSGCYNAMVAPLLPMAVRAVVWYQGESNWAHPERYQGNLQTLIADFRSRWNQPTLPFLVIQLPNFQGNGNALDLCWAILREAQASALSLPHTALAVTIDVGDLKEIHYPNKKPVGERVALIARHAVLGENVVDSGPVFTGAVRDGNAMRANFEDHGSPMILRPSSPQWRSFEVAGSDRQFHPATAEVHGKTVRVHSDEVPEPVALRYCWRGFPAATLFNEAGLPAAPFRTDDWVNAK